VAHKTEQAAFYSHIDQFMRNKSDQTGKVSWHATISGASGRWRVGYSFSTTTIELPRVYSGAESGKGGEDLDRDLDRGGLSGLYNPLE
jgi:hypothetical protein